MVLVLVLVAVLSRRGALGVQARHAQLGTDV